MEISILTDHFSTSETFDQIYKFSKMLSNKNEKIMFNNGNPVCKLLACQYKILTQILLVAKKDKNGKFRLIDRICNMSTFLKEKTKIDVNYVERKMVILSNKPK